MLNDVYNRRIIELAGTIPRIGRLAEPDATATAVSKLCGSTVTVDLKMNGEKVSDFAHEVKACALGQASSSIMASNVIGSTASELRALRDDMRKMLKENAVVDAINQIEAKRASKSEATAHAH
jgi:NifU-like protein involved in Fe-S cluster formation